MDKLERRLARLWRRVRGGKRRERRSKKGESSPQLNRGEIASNNKQRYDDKKDPKDTTALPRRIHSKHEEKPVPNGAAPRRDPPSQDVARALIRLYAYARLKSLQNSIVAGSTSLKSNDSTTTDQENIESFKPLERLSFLSSLPQLSLNRFESREFDKVSF
ncbi:hypothetical protein ANCCEY_04676 [Ancylostoma ceylanicum]|uniref:Uncharacterized protein n=2 Tax=Ancylostoma ceylanicum TaxID=53326 RepID=A0A8I3B1H5_9BILA|nr:hypothetical protein ANCCEY_04676 [Ancylostoma ceylanicum]EYC09197.1 hypothetical protein Y032_0061g3202 [Ancylostoma ceylanicum]